MKTDAELITEANVIANETTPGANTKGRVAQMIIDLIQSKPNIQSLVSALSASTLLSVEEIIEANAAGGALIFTLPLASTKSGKEYTVIKVDNSANSVTLLAGGSDLISGAASKAVDTQWSGYKIKSNGATWTIIGLI
jgi:hypothetical protein